MADNDQWLHDADRLDIPGPRKVKRPRVQLDSEKFGQFAEATARFMGTAKFLVYMTVIVCSWVIWNLVAIYKLGEGYTDNPRRDEDYTMDAVVQHAYKTLRILGIDSAHLIGHSRGGYLTCRLTVEHPELVKSCVIYMF